MIPTGLGDLLHSALDNVLPKELKFVSGALGGILDLETGNLVGAAKNLIDSVFDLKDVAQKPTGNSLANAPDGRPWCYEPPPPPCISWRASPAASATSPRTTPPAAAAPAPAGDPSALSKSSFLGLADDAFMSAIRDGKIPKEIADSKDGMLSLQARMTQITEMNQLMTSMLQAIHQMRMGVVQNLRV
jgi:hypothetical protein